MEAFQIDGSKPAVWLKPLVGPSTEVKRSAESKQVVAHKAKTGSQKRSSRRPYWTRLLDLASGRTEVVLGGTKPTKNEHPYLGTRSGVSGISFQLRGSAHYTRIVLNINVHRGQELLNKSIFWQIEEDRETIERSCPGNWTWDLMEGKKSAKICLELDETVGWADDPDDWDAPMELLIDAMIRFESALRPHIAALDLTD